jgi:hypothetical protein
VDPALIVLCLVGVLAVRGLLSVSRQRARSNSIWAQPVYGSGSCPKCGSSDATVLASVTRTGLRTVVQCKRCEYWSVDRPHDAEPTAR